MRISRSALIYSTHCLFVQCWFCSPRLDDLTVGASAEQARLLKILGHAAFDFLVSRAGQGSVRQVLLSWRESVDNPTDTYLTAIGLSAGDFDRRFGEYLKARFPVQP